MAPSRHARWRPGCATALLLALALAAGAGRAGATPAAARAVPAPAGERWPGWRVDAFQSLGTAEGMPNLAAVAVAEDRQGFIWVATLGGVARWDGHEFMTRRFDPGQAASLPDNVAQVLHRDSRGRLWLGTSGAGLACIDCEGGGPTRITAGGQGLAHVSVRALADDGRGGLWVGSEGGLDHVDGDSGRVRREPQGEHAAQGLRGRGVTALMRDGRGRLWVGSDAGLFVRDDEGAAFRQVALAPPAPGGEPPRPESLLEDSGGRIWVGTNQHGAFVVAADGQPARAVLESPDAGRDATLPARRVMGLVEARPGEVWIATLGQGIVAVDVASGRTRQLRHQPLLPSSLPDDQVRALYRDRSGLVWVATYAGLAHIDPRANAMLTISAAGIDGAALRPRPDYTSLLAHGDGRVWMGTLSHGIEIVDPRSGALVRVAADARHANRALPPDVIESLAEAPDGSVYAGSHRGLYRLRADAGSVPRVTRLAWPGRRAAAAVGPMLRDGARLWIGGLTDGLWLMDLATGGVRAVIADPVRELTDKRITALARGSRGELWIGTRHGLNRYDEAGGGLQKITPGAPAQGALASGFVSFLHVDRVGRLWVGTYGGGLHRMEGDGGGTAAPRFARVAMAQGLPDDNVNAVLEDEAGQLWVSTDSGLAVVDPATLQARGLRRGEGVVHASYWTHSAARTRAGELIFGATGGLTVVRPALLQEWTYRPPVVLSALRVGGRAVPVPVPGAALQIGADANSLAVEFTALDYSAPGRNRYAHRLLGYETEWVPTDARRRVASYAQLPPGHYELQLRGSNRDGVFSDEVLSLPVQVAAAWHQSWWFAAAAVLAALAAVRLVVHQRTRALEARRRELERVVAERTAELQAVSQALTEKSQALEEKSRVLERTSVSDPLTGLHNRRFLAEQIEAVLAANLRRAEAASPAPGATVDTDSLFFLIDVDHFKQVNDDHGHAAGDAVLVQLAQRLRVVMRESDDIVRWGGEEFLAVAHDTHRSRADEIAERLRADVAAAPFLLDDGRQISVSCSIGHACWPFLPQHPQAVDWQGVIKLADLGLLAAKRLGRNAWVGLRAGPDARPQGLLARACLAPQDALATGEVAVSSSHDSVDAVSLALALR